MNRLHPSNQTPSHHDAHQSGSEVLKPRLKGSSRPKQNKKADIHRPDLSLVSFSKGRATLQASERETIRSSIHDAIEPDNCLEAFAVDVLAGLQCELTMIERCRPFVLEQARADAIVTLLVGRLDQAHALVLAMQKGDQAAHDEIEQALARLGIPQEAIEAEAFLISLDLIERLNRLSAQAQLRFDLQLRQIERRKSFALSQIKAISADFNQKSENASVEEVD